MLRLIICLQACSTSIALLAVIVFKECELTQLMTDNRKEAVMVLGTHVAQVGHAAIAIGLCHSEDVGMRKRLAAAHAVIDKSVRHVRPFREHRII